MSEDFPVVTVKISFNDIEMAPEVKMCLHGFYIVCVTSVIFMYYTMLDKFVCKILQYLGKKQQMYHQIGNQE